MSKSELIVGLDIGTTKICAVVGEPSENGGMDIVGIGTSPSTGRVSWSISSRRCNPSSGRLKKPN